LSWPIHEAIIFYDFGSPHIPVYLNRDVLFKIQLSIDRKLCRYNPLMDQKPTFRPYLFPTLLLIIGGWGGLALLLNYTLPEIWCRWGFFALIVLACTGVTVPVSFWLNSVFSPKGIVESRVIVRQSLWVGGYFALLAWLQIGRVLNFTLALWLAIGLIAIEYLLRLRETSAKPAKEDVPPQPPVS
jgi:hypothetical protein